MHINSEHSSFLAIKSCIGLNSCKIQGTKCQKIIKKEKEIKKKKKQNNIYIYTN